MPQESDSTEQFERASTPSGGHNSDEMSAPDSALQLERLRSVLLKPEALVDKISPVIADVLEQEIRNSQDEIAQALAPVMGEALRRQIYQAREDIIDALYPVIGQTINRAVSEAIRELARTVDARVRRSISPQNTWQRWQARLRGVSADEYRLREALPFSAREIFLIHRPSGLLIQHVSCGPEAPADRDLVSGMLTAIRDFTREAFGQGKEGELDSIEYGPQHILIQGGQAAYLAVVIDGVEPVGFREEMRQRLISIHEKHYDGLKSFDGADESLLRSIQKILLELLTQSNISTDSNKALSSFQQFLLAFIALFILLPPILACGWWVLHVERSLYALAMPTSTSAPTATFTPVPTSTPTSTHTPTYTPSATPTATHSPTASPTFTPTPSPTFTPTVTPTFTPSPTATPTATPFPFFGVMVGHVFLRDLPSEAAERTNLIAPLGAPVEILAQYGNWYRVRIYPPNEPDVEMVGWIPARWVTLTRAIPPQLITPTAAP